MVETGVAGFDYFNWIILPLLIFIARMSDVSLATLRHIFMTKGLKTIVPVMSFFEVLIWLVAITQIIQNLKNPVCYIAFAGGFAAGTYVGMVIEEKLAIGMQVVRIITNQDCEHLIMSLKAKGHGVTIVPAQGAMGPVKMIFTIVKRKSINDVVQQIARHNPSAFFSVEDIKNTNQGVFSSKVGSLSYIRRIFPGGKSK